MSAGEDYIAGTVGNKNRNIVTGKDIRQEDHGNHFDFDFGRRSSEEVDETMSEVSRMIREFYRQIALLEYRLAEQEQKFNIAAFLIGIALAAIIWKLYFGG